MNLSKILGTPAGCPWDTQRGKQGSTGRCPMQGYPVVVVSFRKSDKKGAFCRDIGRVYQGHLAVQGVFRDFM